ncbi:photosynthesis system II assembly factor Ycf48 [Candidatus Cyanaurora vandensis]|uniref:photosynthesis system II assembly factor Ycf48 n=1 Tax=Candidatus Cyanaurora vandensis TaxID=2714958 RepID=UPI00257C8952|nr:photosynthesis system II assembly factor Ycf48 [Candidatus Cyanaurora vandensis]
MLGVIGRWCGVLTLVLLVQACNFIKTAEQVPWSEASLTTEADLLDVHFVDSQTGWMVGTKTTVLKTIDGGTTWRPAFDKPLQGDKNAEGETADLNARFVAVAFTPNGQEGWISGNPRIVLHTTNGGKSWFAIPLNKRIVGNPLLITALDTGVAEMAMNTGFVFKTENGGKVWRALTPTSAGGIRNITRLEDGSYWAVSVRGSSYLSWKPGEREWKLRERKSSRRIQNLVFVDNQRGLMLNNGGEVQLTSDGGETWSKPTTPDIASAAGLLDSGVDEKGRIWVTGGNGTLLVSSDLGKTWAKAPLQTRSTLFRIRFEENGQGFIMGQRGLILRYQAS